jgi:hypothetical protein
MFYYKRAHEALKVEVSICMHVILDLESGAV